MLGGRHLQKARHRAPSLRGNGSGPLGPPRWQAPRSNPAAAHDAALDRFVAALLAMTPVSPIW